MTVDLKKGTAGDQMRNLLCVQLASYREGGPLLWMIHINPKYNVLYPEIQIEADIFLQKEFPSVPAENTAEIKCCLSQCLALTLCIQEPPE